jgi:myo-inositol-1(or 4)-monophosphatase
MTLFQRLIKRPEKAIINEIKKAFPKHSILAEESGKTLGDDDFLWIIDPLDGTTNYLHGFPQYAVSIALLEKGVTSHAVIYDPFKEELFTASKGEGAYLNNERIRVTISKGTRGYSHWNWIPIQKSSAFRLLS